MNDGWFRYLKKIIESYNDSKSMFQEIGEAIDKIDDDVNILAGKKTPSLIEKSPLGKINTCAYCSSSYNVHIPKSILVIRCPVCNELLRKKR